MYQYEMITHVPINTHNKPSEILVISDNLDKIKKELDRYSSFISFNVIYINSENTKEVDNNKDKKFDVVIADISLDKLLAYKLESLLSHNGVLATRLKDICDVNEYQYYQNYQVVMPYITNEHSLLLLSKHYHPTADVVLFRTDLIDGLEYYNTDIHTACFILPNYIKKKIKGYVKN